MSELTDRLREERASHILCSEAADEIDRLEHDVSIGADTAHAWRAERDAARASAALLADALRQIAGWSYGGNREPPKSMFETIHNTARAALAAYDKEEG